MHPKSGRDVVITGIGLVTSLGVGLGAHVEKLRGAEPLLPVLDFDVLPSHPVHPLPEIDWSGQIPRRGDQRQMENWQRLGVYAAGLALDDAGLKEDLDACAEMDLFVAAGGGERDVAVDSLIVEAARGRDDREIVLNEKLTTELRPTLFLAQLSNLLAGNITIVHKVTGSSRTFMGEESAGVSAFEIAHARIAAGQSTRCLVGSAFVAERPDIMFHVTSLGQNDRALAQSRDPSVRPDGVVLGTVGAFMVLEERSAAEARGARIYATLDAVAGDRGSREENRLEQRLIRLADTVAPEAQAVDLVVSAAPGIPAIDARQAASIDQLYPDATLRRPVTAFGHSVEAQFPLSVALAALAVAADHPLAPLAADDRQGNTPARTAVIAASGMRRGEAMARVSRFD
ncbi:beta-ketoacyl-ACP synthase [Pseudohoeflea sp. DP4N28-3]|uniref:Beta-ketoacyl-ACP synthase n=2 Tax=Pseudohoeflea coraliihabitans TaxID=2860393 RepID=A0ABS6WIF9_9HYPH|nr:beta-ketoacyl-ACP synthase [Pseudohoeflea sp. DP4N28-3]MBW3095732.1 beta-ketoacyl-ACP synthase [Pseudohoeflea sp. DP4N28-3]